MLLMWHRKVMRLPSGMGKTDECDFAFFPPARTGFRKLREFDCFYQDRFVAMTDCQ